MNHSFKFKWIMPTKLLKMINLIFYKWLFFTKKPVISLLRVLYWRRDLNPYGHYCPLDFKSSVSTNSTTSACGFFSKIRIERKTGFEPATSTLARWRSTNWAIFAFKLASFVVKAVANLKLLKEHQSIFREKKLIIYLVGCPN